MNRILIRNNIIFTVVANILKLVTSFILTILVPRYMGGEQYGYWQLFLLYTTYLGYSYLGVADGLYLKDGGKEYSELDYEKYSNEIIALSLYEIVLAIIIVCAGSVFMDSELKLYLLLWACIDMVLYIPRQTLKLVLQATSRIKEYSISIAIFVVTNCLFICGLLFLGLNDVKLIVIVHALTELISLIYTVLQCKEIICFRKLNLVKGIKDAFDDLKIGINVLIASAASTVSIGIIRNGIENKWGIEQFGAVSLALSISKLFLVFINSVAVVLFPILRRINQEKRTTLYCIMRNVLIFPFWILMIIYNPAKYVISIILPRYSTSLDYVTILIPMCLYECIMALIVNTYLKTLRKERTLLIINLGTILVSIVVTYLSVYVIGSIYAALIAILFVIMCRTIVGEIIVRRLLCISGYKDLVLDNVMSILFILIYSQKNMIISILLFSAALTLYCTLRMDDLKSIIMLGKNYLHSGE